MKNIRTIFKIGAILAGMVAAIPFLLFAAYIIGLWVTTDFNPDFLRIDSCFDAGGRWDYENRICSGDPNEFDIIFLNLL